MIEVLELGQIVFSKAGRDKRRPFVVIGIEEDHAYLADGKLRLVESPKRKKYKHVQKTNEIVAVIKQKIIEEVVTNSDIRNVLKEYINNSINEEVL